MSQPSSGGAKPLASLLYSSAIFDFDGVWSR
jgi:hypothetical protein